MTGDRPTRLQKAKQDWSGLRARRELILAVSGGLLGAGALVIFGWGEAALQQVVVVVVTALLAAVLLPLAEFVICWLQAPIRLLSDDVNVVREQIERIADRLESQSLSEISKEPEPALDVRLTLLNHLRIGKEIVSSPNVRAREVDPWTNEVASFMSKHIGREPTERFLTGTNQTGMRGLHARVKILSSIAKELEETPS